MEFWSIVLDIVVILAGAMLAGGIFARFGQSPIVGYILAGMILGGRGSFGLIKSESEIEAVAELGVSLLLFGLGLEFSWKSLCALGSRVLVSGALQVLCTLGITSIIAILFSCSLPLALVIGSMLCLSSTACVLRTLAERGEQDSSHGRNSLAILLVQDIAVVVLSMLVVVVCESGIGIGTITTLGRVLLLAAGLVLILYIFINKIVIYLLGAFSVQKNRDLGVLLAVTLGIGSTWAAHQVNISPALGAFIAGMFLGSSPFAVQVRADVSSLQVVLLTLFFGSAGMLADPMWIISNWALVFSLAFGIIILKSLIVSVILVGLGQPVGTAVVTGICVSQVGEFAFVLADIATKAKVLPDELGLLLISSTIITMFLTPFMLKIAPRIGAAVAKNKYLSQLKHKPVLQNGSHRHETKILIIGYGPAGQMTASALTEYGEAVLVLDLNKSATGKKDGKPFRLEIGDATREDVLLHSNVADAEIVVITLPDRKHSLQVLHLVKKLAPNAWVIVRARYHRDTESYYTAGASMVVDEEAHVGMALAEYTKSFA